MHDSNSPSSPEAPRHSLLPSGTVTLVFTDIEGSSDLWEQHHHTFQPVLDEHNRLMRETAARWDGFEVKTEGDAFFLSFSRASDAVQFAVDAQLAFHRYPWSSLLTGLQEIRVRMGIHTGEPLLGVHPDGMPDYFGPVVNRAARVGAAGHGGQIVVSGPTHALVQTFLPHPLSFHDLGQHRLKGVGEEHLWQACHPDLHAHFPPLKTMDRVRHNLPLQPTPFIGREKEMAELQELLSSNWLLTLTGPGGTGKTRLALQAAEEAAESFTDGVFFVDLSSLTDPALVLPAIAGALGVREEGGRPLLESIKSHFKRKEFLLVLDNFEQVVDAAEVVAQIWSGCPGMKALVTSRTPLRLKGEQEFSVPPLSLPAPGQWRDAGEDLVSTLSQYAAVELFIGRAQAARHDFSVTNENAPAVAEICHRLDGLPLAIELAAARIKLLSPAGILDRLQNRLKLLTGGPRNLPLRQQTLRSAIAWSYDLLEEEEKILFRRLSVFAGGFTLAAADAVVGGRAPVDDEQDASSSTSRLSAPIPAPELGILDGVSSLVDKSLLRQREGQGGESRFVMLETIREFGLERLDEAGEAAKLQAAHAAFFGTLATDAEHKLYGPDQREWLERLVAEQQNLRTSQAWQLLNNPEAALRQAGALCRLWWYRGELTEGRQQLAAVMEKTSGFPKSADRAKVLNAAGILAHLQGDYRGAAALWTENIDTYRELNNQQGIALSLGNIGGTHHLLGDLSTARDLFQESLARYRELDDRMGIALSLGRLGSVTLDQGDCATARSLHEESLSLYRALGDKNSIAIALGQCGAAARNQGDLDGALRFHEESLSTYQDVGNKGGVALALASLGILAEARGEKDAARSLYERSLALTRGVGDRDNECKTLSNLANLAFDEGDYKAAYSMLSESLSGMQELGRKSPCIQMIEAIARVFAARGIGIASEKNEIARAVRLWGASHAIRDLLKIPILPNRQEEFEAHVRSARDRLGQDHFQEAWNEGQSMTLDEAVEYALKDET